MFNFVLFILEKLGLHGRAKKSKNLNYIFSIEKANISAMGMREKIKIT